MTEISPPTYEIIPAKPRGFRVLVNGRPHPMVYPTERQAKDWVSRGKAIMAQTRAGKQAASQAKSLSIKA